ncbi:hypothetical protein N9N67_02280 [Bacteriovoracaceae bacterium]|nr:hypothetical protein [Bacteriovoracaceae bacterium]
MNLIINKYLPIFILLFLCLFLSRNLIAQSEAVNKSETSKQKKELKYSAFISFGSSEKTLELRKLDYVRDEDKRLYKPNSREVTGFDFSSEYFSLGFNYIGDFNSNANNTVRTTQKDFIYRSYFKSFFISAAHYEYYGFYLEDENLDPDIDQYTRYSNLKNIGNELMILHFHNPDYIKNGFTYFSPNIKTSWSYNYGLKYFNSSTRSSQDMAPLKLENDSEKELLEINQEGLSAVLGISGTYVNEGFFVMGMMNAGFIGMQRIRTSYDNHTRQVGDFFSSYAMADIGGIAKRSRYGFALTLSSSNYDITNQVNFDQSYSVSRFYYRYFF